MSLTQHPLSQAFPSMGDEDFQALKDDIEVNGQREPVMILDGMVLDGWHRYRACVELDIKPTQFNFSPDDDPVVFVKSQNLHRRHLTASQRAAAIVACSAWRPAHRPNKVATVATLSKTNEQIAKEAGVKVRTVTDVKAAKTAGLIDLVVEGALTANEAAQVARGTPAKKPTKTVAKPEVAAVPAHDPDQEDAIAILSEENDRLNDRLATVAMDATPEERSAAAETIAGLRAEIKTLKAELSAVKASRDSYMVENRELKNQCASQRKQLAKLNK